MKKVLFCWQIIYYFYVFFWMFAEHAWGLFCFHQGACYCLFLVCPGCGDCCDATTQRKQWAWEKDMGMAWCRTDTATQQEEEGMWRCYSNNATLTWPIQSSSEGIVSCIFVKSLVQLSHKPAQEKSVLRDFLLRGEFINFIWINFFCLGKKISKKNDYLLESRGFFNLIAVSTLWEEQRGSDQMFCRALSCRYRFLIKN